MSTPYPNSAGLLRGLTASDRVLWLAASVLCAIYENATPEEIVSTEPEVFDALGIAQNLTPTRLNGLASVRGAIREYAQCCLA